MHNPTTGRTGSKEPVATLISQFVKGKADQLALCDMLEEIADSLPDRIDRAKCLRAADDLEPLIHSVHKFEEEVAGPLVTERILKIEMPSKRGGGAPDSAALRIARQNVVAHFHYLGSLAIGRKWIAGDAFSFADLAAAAALSVVDYLGEAPWSADPAVKAWYQKLKSRPSFRPLLSDKARLVAPAPHYADLDF